ncbi:MAG TPA: aspartate carbamoyltransferase, partial [Candidatus Nitrosotenuis sp.]|nr:aspartate carbamoyltransferase [Candidatus Nitrosotenuis sp.]
MPTHAPGLQGQSLVSIRDLDRPSIEQILQTAARLGDSRTRDLAGRQVALLFYEPSTRTYNSFVTAVHQLGGSVCGFASAQGTSVEKGETLHDTVKMFEAYAEAIVLRHPRDGAARWAADCSRVPVINAGDGKNQHPTQTLLDLYAIQATQGRLDELQVALVGDLKYGRTAHSLAEALALFQGNTVHLVAPPPLQMPEHLCGELRRQGLALHHHERIEEVLTRVDVLYMTRIQRERMPDETEFEKVRGIYRLSPAMLRGARPNMKVMHPLPRVDEIHPDVDRSPHAYYFQ